jgi:hypothetical protein
MPRRPPHNVSRALTVAVGFLFLPFRLFLPFQGSSNLRSELAYPVCRQPPTCLQNYRLIAFYPSIWFAGEPQTRDRARSECAGIKRKLRPKLPLPPVVRYEISHEGVPRPRPKPRATASIVAWLVSKSAFPPLDSVFWISDWPYREPNLRPYPPIPPPHSGGELAI